MPLFSSKSALDADLAAVALPNQKHSHNAVAEISSSIRANLQPGETIKCIGAGDKPVTVVTNKRVLSFAKNGQVAAADLADVRDVKIEAWRGFSALVTASPNIRAPFQAVSDGTRFAAVLERRDVPTLNPSFFEGVLAEISLPLSPINIARLQTMVARQIAAGGAFAYFGQTGDSEGQELFTQRFLDWDRIGSAELPTLADRMIDWLWERNWQFHDPLRTLVPKIRGMLTEQTSPLRSYDTEIPEQQW